MASLNAALAVQRTGNAIEQVRLATDRPGLTAQTFANVAANTFYMLTTYGSVKPTAKWDISGGPNLRYVVRRSPALNAERRGWQVDMVFNTSYKLTKTLTLQGNLYTNTSEPAIQGTGSSNLYYEFGAKKSFLNEKLDLSLNLSNPFNNTWTYRGTVNTPYFSEQGGYVSYQRAIRVYLAYAYGKAEGGRQRKSIRNDDVKGGGGKQGGR